MKSDLPYLGHISEAIAAIELYVAGGRETFLQQRLIHDAVIRNFEVIGEAANRLSPATRNQAGPVWKKVIAFRNRLIHDYWSVDLLLVWDVIENDLPNLKADVARLAETLGKQWIATNPGSSGSRTRAATDRVKTCHFRPFTEPGLIGMVRRVAAGEGRFVV